MGEQPLEKEEKPKKEKKPKPEVKTELEYTITPTTLEQLPATRETTYCKIIVSLKEKAKGIYEINVPNKKPNNITLGLKKLSPDNFKVFMRSKKVYVEIT